MLFAHKRRPGVALMVLRHGKAPHTVLLLLLLSRSLAAWYQGKMRYAAPSTFLRPAVVCVLCPLISLLYASLHAQSTGHRMAVRHREEEVCKPHLSCDPKI